MSNLRLGHDIDAIRPSLTNGPGWRVSLWTQGCSLRCTTRCLNPHLLSPAGGRLIAVADIIERLRRLHDAVPELEGITVLGGEPLDQPEALAELLDSAHRVQLSTMLYTGQVFETLQSNGSPIVQHVLREVDILVDGPFLPEMYDDQLAWRGSRNQRILCLSHRYARSEVEARFRSQGKAFSIQITPAGAMSVSGLQERAATLQVTRSLRSAPRGSSLPESSSTLRLPGAQSQ